MPFGGSAHQSGENEIEYLIDAVEYYEGVIEEIKKAKRQIFIEGWWISPEIYMRRPVPR